MPFVQAKCENCGGLLQVDSSKKAAICPYCGTPYVVQDAINNYITNIGNLHADVVNVSNDTSAKARIDAAEAFMKLHKYDDAQKAFAEVSMLTPQDYRGWWGQVRAISKEFTEKLDNKSALDKVYSLYKSTLVFVPNQEKYAIEQRFIAYYQPLVEYNTQRCNTLQQRIKNLEGECAKLQSSIDELKCQEYPQVGYMSSGLSGFLAFILVAGIILALINGEIGIFILASIPLAIGLIWEIIIRPINNSAAVSKQRNANMKLEKLYTQRNNVQQELNQNRQLLNKLSN